MPQTEARKTLKDAPVMWRRINSIGVIMDCNSTYAMHMGYAKSEILGRSIFEHVPKEAWADMNDSLKAWFETGGVTDRKITFRRRDGSTFHGVLQATSLYDENGNLLGSNTVIFDLDTMTDGQIAGYVSYFKEASQRLHAIRQAEYGGLDYTSKSEHDGLEQMFEMLLKVDLSKLREC